MPKHKKKNKKQVPDYLNYPDEGIVEVAYPNGEVKTMTFKEYLNSGTGMALDLKMRRLQWQVHTTGKVIPVEGKCQPCEVVQFLEDFSVNAKK